MVNELLPIDIGRYLRCCTVEAKRRIVDPKRVGYKLSELEQHLTFYQFFRQLATMIDLLTVTSISTYSDRLANAVLPSSV